MSTIQSLSTSVCQGMIGSLQSTLPDTSFVLYFRTKFQKDIFEKFTLAIVFID